MVVQGTSGNRGATAERKPKAPPPPRPKPFESCTAYGALAKMLLNVTGTSHRSSHACLVIFPPHNDDDEHLVLTSLGEGGNSFPDEGRSRLGSWWGRERLRPQPGGLCSPGLGLGQQRAAGGRRNWYVLIPTSKRLPQLLI